MIAIAEKEGAGATVPNDNIALQLTRCLKRNHTESTFKVLDTSWERYPTALDRRPYRRIQKSEKHNDDVASKTQ